MCSLAAELEGQDPNEQVNPAGADLVDIDGQLPDIDFDDGLAFCFLAAYRG